MIGRKAGGRSAGPRGQAKTLLAAKKTLVQPLTTATVVIIFLVFILLGRKSFRDRALRLAGGRRIHKTTAAVEDASSRVSRFLQMQLVVNIFYRGTVGLVLWWIGIPHVLLWAVLSCILRFVPEIGIVLAAASPLLLSVISACRASSILVSAGIRTSPEIHPRDFVFSSSAIKDVASWTLGAADSSSNGCSERPLAKHWTLR